MVIMLCLIGYLSLYLLSTVFGHQISFPHFLICTVFILLLELYFTIGTLCYMNLSTFLVKKAMLFMIFCCYKQRYYHTYLLLHRLGVRWCGEGTHTWASPGNTSWFPKTFMPIGVAPHSHHHLIASNIFPLGHFGGCEVLANCGLAVLSQPRRFNIFPCIPRIGVMQPLCKRNFFAFCQYIFLLECWSFSYRCTVIIHLIISCIMIIRCLRSNYIFWILFGCFYVLQISFHSLLYL